MRLLILTLILIAPITIAQTTTKFIAGLQKDIYIGEVDGVSLSLNIALPEKSTQMPQPALVYIHGGGLAKGDKNKFNKQLTKMAKRGVIAASVMYRFATEHRFPAAIEDVKSAIRFLKAHSKELNLNPDRIVILGVSAGAYLATMVGVTGNADGFSKHGMYTDFDSTVAAVISYSGSLADFTNPEYQNFRLVKRFISLNEPDKNKALAAISPVTYLDKNDPLFFLAHGSADEVVPVEKTRDFVLELKKLDHTFEYIEVEGGKHSLSSTHPKKASEVFSASMEFFKKYAFK